MKYFNLQMVCQQIAISLIGKFEKIFTLIRVVTVWNYPDKIPRK